MVSKYAKLFSHMLDKRYVRSMAFDVKCVVHIKSLITIEDNQLKPILNSNSAR